MKRVAIQASALKALHTIMCSGKFMEMLLVPKVAVNKEKSSGSSKLSRASSKEGYDSEDYKGRLQMLMQLLVKRAVMSAPIRRCVSMGELERAQTVLHGSVMEAVAGADLNISETEGMQ